MVEQSFWEMLRTKRDSHLVAGEGLRRSGGYDFPILPLAGV